MTTHKHKWQFFRELKGGGCPCHPAIAEFICECGIVKEVYVK